MEKSKVLAKLKENEKSVKPQMQTSQKAIIYDENIKV